MASIEADGPKRSKSGQFRAVAKEIHDLVERVVEKLDVNGYNPTPVLDIAALIAHADGKITDSEMRALQQVLEPILHQQVDSELVGYLIQASVEVVREAGVEARVRVIAEILLDCDAAEDGVLVAFAVAFAAEQLDKAERAVIDQLARAAKLTPEHVSTLENKAKSLFAA
jgi:tellurite resistance protein